MPPTYIKLFIKNKEVGPTYHNKTYQYLPYVKFIVFKGEWFIDYIPVWGRWDFYIFTKPFQTFLHEPTCQISALIFYITNVYLKYLEIW